MTKLIWGSAGKRFYEAGTDRGVLYLDGTGVAWDGLVSVDESPSGGESEKYYYDGLPYVHSSAIEEFKATIEAYTWPVEFSLCDGSEEIAQGLYIGQQNRKEFGLSYRTLIGNDLDELEHGYKIHIVYNCMAGPSSRTYSSMSEDADPTMFKWSISTRPVKFDDSVFGTRYGAHLVLDSREVYPWAMTAVEEVLYGTDDAAPHLPTPEELLTLFIDNAILKITDNGDGTWTAEGPDSIISMLTTDIFQINWTSANMIDETKYTVSTF